MPAVGATTAVVNYGLEAQGSATPSGAESATWTGLSEGGVAVSTAYQWIGHIGESVHTAFGESPTMSGFNLGSVLVTSSPNSVPDNFLMMLSMLESSNMFISDTLTIIGGA